MSKFTTETRYICETYADMDSQAGSINDTIDKSIPYIFSDDWNTYDPSHKPELCRKILRHYWMREIGFETVGLWKLEMNEYLAEIMPKYNRMWENLEPIKADLLNNGDITETKDLAGTHDITNDNKGTAHTEGGTTNKQDTTGTNHSTETGTDHTEGTSKDTTGQTSKSNGTTSGTTSSSSDGWQEANDTPQGGLTGLDERHYLSSAVHNRGTNSGNTSQKSDNTASVDTTENITNSQDEKTNTTTDGKTTEGITGSTTNNQDSNTTENKSEKEHHDESYILKIKGKNNGTSYIDEYLKLMNQYDDIDRLIIRDLNVCFMGLWE